MLEEAENTIQCKSASSRFALAGVNKMDPSRKRREVWKFISFANDLKQYFHDLSNSLFNLFISSYDARIAIRFCWFRQLRSDVSRYHFPQSIIQQFCFLLIFQAPIMVFFRTFTSFCVEYTKTSWTNFLSLPYFCQVSPLWFLMRFCLR